MALDPASYQTTDGIERLLHDTSSTYTFDLIRVNKLNIGIKPHPHNLIIHSSVVVNKLKEESDQLQIHMDNATDSIAS